MVGQVAASHVNQLGGHAPAPQIGRARDVRTLVHGQDPLVGPHVPLGVDQIGDLHNLRLALLDPVKARQAAVEDAVLHITGHLLGAQQHAPDLIVINVGMVLALIHIDLVPGVTEYLEGRFLQAPLRQPQP